MPSQRRSYLPFNLICGEPVWRDRESAFAMQLDPARYRHHLATFALSESDEEALLEQLWRIAHYHADQAFGLTSEQILLGKTATKVSLRPAAKVDSDHALTSTFNSIVPNSASGKAGP